jgi:hypothetical protein
VSHESTDLHRARVGSATGAVLLALLLGWFPLNEAAYLLFGRTTHARVTDSRPARGFHQRVAYMYQDASGREHADSCRVRRAPATHLGTVVMTVEYRTLPWQASRPAGADWVGLAMFEAAAVVAGWLVIWHRRDLHQFWRREQDMAGF